MPHRQSLQISIRQSVWTAQQVAIKYTCAWCGDRVASNVGVDATDPATSQQAGALRGCPSCGYPTYIAVDGAATPAVPYGDEATAVPPTLAPLYEEARDCVGVGAYHAAVMVCRKILMHAAVSQGAPTGASFLAYVDFLVDSSFIPPGARSWVDEIRQIGNDANHEIFDIDEADARTAVDFVTMLLKILYEYPALGASSVAARAAKDGSAGAAPGAR